MKNKKIISKLIAIVSEKNVLIDNQSKSIYGKDLTEHDMLDPLAIVFPENNEEVVKIVELANSTGTGLVPSGGRTGYSGGAVAKNKEIVVSFSKMNRIIHFDEMEKSIQCEAGVITYTIQEMALKNNLFFPVDFASSKTSQVGGNVATNAGGINVIRYGSIRNWVTGLKVVTGNGDFLELNHGLTKNNSGYDLRHLFIGSEGTLGFVTEITLKLTTPPKDTKVMLIPIPNRNYFTDILNLFSKMTSLIAFEFFSSIAASYVISDNNLDYSFLDSASFYILLEYESSAETDRLANEIIKKILPASLWESILISQNVQQALNLWKLRKEISFCLSKYSPHKYDISVLPSQVSPFMEEVDAIFHRIFPELEVVWFGHLGDGNLHLNILKPNQFSKKEFTSIFSKIDEHVYALIGKYHGSISAEHGVGLLKKSFLSYSKSKVEISYMKSIKKAFDKNKIMNPGKIFD